SIAPWTGFCSGDAQAFTAKVFAYRTEGTFPANKDDLSGFFYVRVNGVESDATSLMGTSENRYRITNDGKNGEFDLTFCVAQDIENSIQVGLYFTNGNEVCATVTK